MSVLLHLRVHADLRLHEPSAERPKAVLLAKVRFGRDPVPVLDAHLLLLGLPRHHLYERGPPARAPGGPALARVLPAVLPAGDHAVLRGVPAGARAAEADQGASRPGHRDRGRSAGGDL